MNFLPAGLPGVALVESQSFEDERGFFARTFCRREFAAHGLDSNVVQCSLSFNSKRGTLRGMHFQAAPHEEAKLVRCVRGAIYDVIVDLRPASPTFRQWRAYQLNERNRHALFIPVGLAHGFQTLEDDSEVFYQMSAFYEPEAGRGVRWNDPAFGIRWPIADAIISERDRGFADFSLGRE